MTILWSNNASTTVAGAITPTSTTIALAAGTGVSFPNPTGGNYYVATLYDQATKTIYEILHVTAMSGDTATIQRAQEGTTARAWSTGDIFANLVTAGTLNNFVQAGTGPVNTSTVYVGTDTSATAGTIICATNPVPASLAIGMVFDIKVKNTNLGPVTLQLNGLAGVAATRTDGSPMVGGNLIANQNYLFMYNGTNFNSTIPPIPSAPPQTVFYVRPDGNDSNSGFANTSASAFKTISGAMAQIKARYIAQNGVTVRVADGSYTDAIWDNTSYIGSWNIVGNTANPGNVLINATPTAQGSYPPNASIARCVVAYGPANITMNGFSFQAYYENAASSQGGTMVVYNCAFTAPTSGVSAPIEANSSGKTFVYGNCSYSGAVAASYIFAVYDNGTLSLGYHDGLTNNYLTFNINGTPTLTGSTAIAFNAANLIVFNQVVAFTGGIPNCRQYICQSAGGISFTSGVTTIFPGTQPGVVNSPGWTG
jgi:hypothetical protein